MGIKRKPYSITPTKMDSQSKQKSTKDGTTKGEFKSRNSAHISLNESLPHQVISYISIICSLIIPKNENQTIHKYLPILFQIYVVVVVFIILYIENKHISCTMSIFIYLNFTFNILIFLNLKSTENYFIRLTDRRIKRLTDY